MNVLHLTLKKKWFDEIMEGRKRHEYREDKPYWRARLLKVNPMDGKLCIRKFDRVHFKNGYSKNARSMVVDCLGVELNNLVIEGLSGGKARRYFDIKLGSIQEYTSAGYTVYPSTFRYAKVVIP
jgi:hypothetical protein